MITHNTNTNTDTDTDTTNTNNTYPAGGLATALQVLHLHAQQILVGAGPRYSVGLRLVDGGGSLVLGLARQ